MRVRVFMTCVVVLILASLVNESEAGRRRACRLWNCGVGDYTCFDTETCAPCAPCAPVCPPIQYQEVQCQVMVPEKQMETRIINVTEYHQQLQERTVTVYQQVPREVVRQVQHTVCEPVPRTKVVPVVTCRPVYEEREVSYNYCEPVYEQHEGTRTVMDPVWEDVTREFTVMVPRVEWKTGTRMTCRWEPTQTTRTVCVDRGCWEDRVVGMVPFRCGPCCQTVCRPITCRVWRPNLVQEQVPCTVYRPVQVPVEFQYCTTVCEPQVRTCVEKVCRYQPREVSYTYTTCRWVPKTATRTVKVCRYVQETSTRTCQYVEMVPRTETREVRCTVYDCVPTEKTVQVSVCVPVTVQKEVQVEVCKMVPKTVVRKIPVPCTTCQ